MTRTASQYLFDINPPHPIDGHFIVVEGAAVGPALVISQLGMDVTVEEVIRLKP